MPKLSRLPSPKDLQDWKPMPAPVIKPAADMIAPGAGSPRLLTTSPARNKASPADLAPPAGRPQQDANLAHPSRVGNRLHWRDGRITDLNGTVLTNEHGHPLNTRAPADYKPLNRVLS
jgi:hypothetical protein